MLASSGILIDMRQLRVPSLLTYQLAASLSTTVKTKSYKDYNKT